MENYNDQRVGYYDRRAPEYDDAYLGTGLWADLRRKGSEEELRALGHAISGLSEVGVLDVACGTGFLTRHLRGEFTGLDQSEEMLKIARQRIPEATFVQGDAFSLPFPGASFDRVFTSNFYGLLLSHERSAFLREVRRVAPELVVVETTPPEMLEEGWQERTLSDGSRHRIFRRYFRGDDLAEELGGRVLFAGKTFVMVAA
jgi:ubiquinone/menaquinone biosynthesis C-methylase UbiE